MTGNSNSKKRCGDPKDATGLLDCKPEDSDLEGPSEDIMKSREELRALKMRSIERRERAERLYGPLQTRLCEENRNGHIPQVRPTPELMRALKVKNDLRRAGLLPTLGTSSSGGVTIGFTTYYHQRYAIYYVHIYAYDHMIHAATIQIRGAMPICVLPVRQPRCRAVLMRVPLPMGTCPRARRNYQMARGQ